MSSALPRDGGLTRRALGLVAPVILAALVVLAFSNTLPNAFALDDSHSIEQNAAIRTLDASSIRRFFTDLSAFSALPANWDYRPLLLVTYAINYRWSGYDPVSWHWVNIALHWLASLGLFFIGRMLIGSGRLSPARGLPAPTGDWIALAAAALFAVHPLATECVNYISARSSLMVAAFVLPAMGLYLSVLAGRAGAWALGGAWVLFLGALLTKIEAIALAPVLLFAEWLLAPTSTPRPLWPRWPSGRSWARVLPFLLLAVAYGLFWSRVSTLDTSRQRAAAGMTSEIYLLTQTRAWWHYVGEAIAPVHMVTDDTAFPISGAASPEELGAGAPPLSAGRALRDGRVWLAVTGWFLVLAAGLATASRFPAGLFLLGAFFAFLMPHSSVVPLAEMVNGHRPYLPVAGLFILGATGGWLLVRAIAARPIAAATLTFVLVAVPLTALTRERNRVWRDDVSLWSDSVRKSPDSGRAQMNYGVALMRRGRMVEAESRFRRALELTPGYHYAHTNLAIALAAQGDFAGATAAHDRAVTFADLDASAFYYRGLYRTERGDRDGAVADFRAALERSPSGVRETAALIDALHRSGADAQARAIEEAVTPADREAVAAERFRLASAAGRGSRSTSLNDQGVRLMGERRFAEARELFRLAIEADPGNPLPMTNTAILNSALGDEVAAVDWHAKAVAADSGSPTALYWRARWHAEHARLLDAITDLEAASARPGAGVTELAALTECLVKAGRAREAAAVEARGVALDAERFRSAREAFRPLLASAG